jgi:hypothetical protein
MNRKLAVALCCAVLSALLLAAGCGKSPQEKYGSNSFMVQSTAAVIDALKDALPSKSMYEIPPAIGKVSGSLAKLPAIVPSAAGKAKIQKASETFEKELRPVIETLQYDAVAMGKKLDQIRATVLEVGKEIE